MKFKAKLKKHHKKFAKSRKILIIRVGSDERPAGPLDLEAMRANVLANLSKATEGYEVLITHHAVDFDFMEVP